MRLKTLITVLLAAALAASVAVAAPGPPPGKAKAEAAKAAAKARREARLKAREESQVLDGCRPRVAYILRGTLVSLSVGEGGAGSLALLVQKTNRHARAFVGKQATLTLGEHSKLRGPGVEGAAEGSRVLAHVRGCKDAGESVELYARHVVVGRPKAEKEPEATTASSD